MRFLDWYGEHKILVIYFPAHSTHRLQPLDVSIFGPLAQYYSEEGDLWLYKCIGLRSFTKRNFFAVFWPAFLKAFSIKNILSAFKKAGLQPKEYNYVIKAVTRQPLEETEHSSSPSVLLTFEVRAVRKLLKSVVEQKVTKKTRKLRRYRHKMSFLSMRTITFKVLLLRRRSSVPVAEDFLKKCVINRRVKP